MSGDSGQAKISAQDWESLYHKYFPKLRHYFVSQGLRFVDAEDLAHDVFQELGHGKVPEDPNTYIYAIARNVLFKHRRRKIAEHGVLDEYCRRVTTENEHRTYHAPDAGPSEEDPTAEVERIIRTVSARLPAKYAELMALRFSKGLSAKELAPLMNCSEDAVQKRIQRLRAVLRQLIQDETI